MSKSDCSRCLSLRHGAHTARFNCRWCSSTCRSDLTCSTSASVATHACPPPHITSVFNYVSPLRCQNFHFNIRNAYNVRQTALVYKIWGSVIVTPPRLAELFMLSLSKPTFSTNPSHLRLLLPTGLPSWQRDMLIVLFLVSHFNFLFVPCGGLSWLPVRFLLHVKYTLSYRIISFVLSFCLWAGWVDDSRLR